MRVPPVFVFVFAVYFFVFTIARKVAFFIALLAIFVRSRGVDQLLPLPMPSNESKWVFFSPSFFASAFILPMKDFTRAERVEPVPNLSASAYAASQPDGSISPYSSWRTVTLSPTISRADEAFFDTM
ncbi:hypothetical protein SALBM217S_03142 [Streptomyces griseoloalbus]